MALLQITSYTYLINRTFDVPVINLNKTEQVFQKTQN